MLLYYVSYRDNDGNTFTKEVASDKDGPEEARRQIIDGLVAEGYWVTKITPSKD